jgi:hypothetical protein
MNLQMKISRIKTLIARLETGETVSNRSLERVLTEAQILALEADWVEEKSLRKVTKPLDIKKYEAMVKNALLLNGRADRMHFLKTPAHKITAMSNKAESAFLDAFLFLEEAIERDNSLKLWIDRDLKDASWDPIGVPRVIGSQSFECLQKQKVPFPVLTKRQLKIQILEAALDVLEAKPEELCHVPALVHLPSRRELNFDRFKF